MKRRFNKALYMTDILLYFIATGELGLNIFKKVLMLAPLWFSLFL